MASMRHLSRVHDVFRSSLTAQQVDLLFLIRQPVIDVFKMDVKFSHLQRGKKNKLLTLFSFLYFEIC